MANRLHRKRLIGLGATLVVTWGVPAWAQPDPYADDVEIAPVAPIDPNAPPPVAAPSTVVVTPPPASAPPAVVATPPSTTTTTVTTPAGTTSVVTTPPAAGTQPVVTQPGLPPTTPPPPPPGVDPLWGDEPTVEGEAGVAGTNFEVPPGAPPPPGVPPPPLTAGTTATTVDGHLREGAFLSSPGSLAFITHHTLMGAAGGLVTMGVPGHFRWEPGGREAMVIGTLLGAGLGFGASTWWQFNHWVGMPAAEFSIINSVLGGMLFTGIGNLATRDRTFMAWSGFLGAELAAWLTTVFGTGDLQLSDGLLITSGGLWAMALGGLILAIVGNSGAAVSQDAIANTLLIAPGIGAGLAALSMLKWRPTTMQVLRADAFGAGIGGGILLITGLLLGFNSPTPYILGLAGSAVAITAVSIFWEESAERFVRLPSSNRLHARPRYTGWW